MVEMLLFFMVFGALAAFIFVCCVAIELGLFVREKYRNWRKRNV